MAYGPAVLTPRSAAEAAELFGNGDDTMVIGTSTTVHALETTVAGHRSAAFR